MLPLWSVYLTTRSQPDRNALVVHYLPLTGRVINSLLRGKVKRHSGHYVSVEELQTAGHIGLIKGVEKFDPACGVKPETYLSQRIRGEVQDELRRLDPLTRRDRKKVNRGEMEMPRAAAPVAMGSMRRADEDEYDPAGSGMTPDGVVRMKEALREAFAGRTEREIAAMVMYHLERSSQRDAATVAMGRAWPPVRNVPRWTRKILFSGSGA